MYCVLLMDHDFSGHTQYVWLLPISFFFFFFLSFYVVVVSNFKLKFIASIHLPYSDKFFSLCHSGISMYCIRHAIVFINAKSLRKLTVFLSEFIWIEYKLKFIWRSYEKLTFLRVFIDLAWQWTGFLMYLSVLCNLPRRNFYRT